MATSTNTSVMTSEEVEELRRTGRMPSVVTVKVKHHRRRIKTNVNAAYEPQPLGLEDRGPAPKRRFTFSLEGGLEPA